jgi:hypothetical protein
MPFVCILDSSIPLLSPFKKRGAITFFFHRNCRLHAILLAGSPTIFRGRHLPRSSEAIAGEGVNFKIGNFISQDTLT